jgi:hypothetical protein
MVKRKKSGPSRWDNLVINVKQWLGMKVILCDSCKYDWRQACHQPARPNAVWCPDYSKRGS